MVRLSRLPLPAPVLTCVAESTFCCPVYSSGPIPVFPAVYAVAACAFWATPAKKTHANTTASDVNARSDHERVRG
jgi:hypothetical protein